MNDLSTVLKELRSASKRSTKEVSTNLKIDSSLLSRFETGDRIPTKIQLQKIAKYYKVPLENLMVTWLSEKIYKEIVHEDFALQALQVAESRIGYKKLNYDNSDLIKQIDELKIKLDAKRPIPKAQLKNLYEYYRVEYTYESNRIEGNTLTLSETALVVEKGITISGKSLREHLEAINHAEAIDVLTEFVENKMPLTEYLVKQLHAIILRGIDKENAGRYRSLNVKITGSKHLPPEPYMLNKLMEDYIIFYEESKNRLHPVILAAEMHERLVTIHPFIDGNGRTSRLIMNLVLLQNGFLLANISGEKENRMKYYNSLENAQVNHSKKPFYEFVAKAVLTSLEEYLKIIN